MNMDFIFDILLPASLYPTVHQYEDVRAYCTPPPLLIDRQPILEFSFRGDQRTYRSSCMELPKDLSSLDQKFLDILLPWRSRKIVSKNMDLILVVRMELLVRIPVFDYGYVHEKYIF
jgi:hypothetical protein